VVIGPLLLFAPALLAGKALFWGAPMLQFTPWRLVARRILLTGHLPLWNPWLGMGAPLLANYQSALLYPPNWLLLLLDVSWGQTMLVMLHLIWAGAGMLCLTRRLGFGRLGQGVTSLSFAMCAYLVARSGFLSMNAAAAWLPWVLWAVEGQAGSRNRGKMDRTAIPMLGVILCMQWLAGHAQLSWYTLLLAGAWSIWRGAQQGRLGADSDLLGIGQGCRGALAGGGRFLLAASIGLLLAAAQLLPTAEYLRQSARSAGLEQGFAFTYSLWPWRLLGLLAPDLFGHPAQGNYWGYANYWEDALYLGTLPLLLALGAALGRGRPHSGLRWFLIAAGAFSLVLALGDHLPVFPFLFRYVPTFDLFQAPTRWSLLLSAALSLLAGMGADRWQAPGPRGTYWLRLGTVGAATVVAVAWLAPRLLPGLQPTLAPAIGRAGLLLGLSGALALLRPNLASLRWDTVALGLVLADLTLAGFRLNPVEPRSLQQGLTPRAAPLADGHRLYMPPDLEQSVKFDRHFRFDDYQPEHDWAQVRLAELPNTTVLDGLPSANNFDPLLAGRYEAFLANLRSASPAAQTEILDLMDVGWVAIRAPNDPAGARYERRPGAQRARLVPTAQWVQGPEQALAALQNGAYDPARTVLLEGPLAPTVTSTGGPGEIRLLEPGDSGRVELQVAAPEGGWVVLHDTWYPGWRAEVDGQPTPIYVADALFRAVWSPAGNHSIVFRYAPGSFIVGAAISLGAWIGLLVFMWRRRASSEDAIA
jgi:hypothetical protein